MLTQTNLAKSAGQNRSMFQIWHLCQWFVITAGDWIQLSLHVWNLPLLLTDTDYPHWSFSWIFSRQIPEFFSNKPSWLPFIKFPLLIPMHALYTFCTWTITEWNKWTYLHFGMVICFHVFWMCCRKRLITAYSTFCTRQLPLKASGSLEPCLFGPFGGLCDGCNGPWLKKFPCHFTCITSLCWAFWSLWCAFWFWSRCLQCLQCFFLKHKKYV